MQKLLVVQYIFFYFLHKVIQGNLLFNNIGFVIYVTPPTPPPPIFPLDIIIGVAAVGFVLLILIFILTAIFRGRVKRAEKVTKKLLDEMEKLEESMAGKIRDGELRLYFIVSYIIISF